MLVEKVMTREVVTLNPYMSLRDAAQVLANHGISGAPVVDADGILVGILTESDILRAVESATDRIKMVFPSLHTMGVFFEMSRGEVEILKAFEEEANTIVADIMTKKVDTCTPGDAVSEAARTLITKDINRLPVLDEEGRLVGILTRGDIVRSFSELNCEDAEG